MTAFTESALAAHPVQIASSTATNTRSAIEDVLAEVHARQAAFTFVFYGPDHDADVIAESLEQHVGHCGVGGSTAGEIAPTGFQHGSIVALALHGPGVKAGVRIVPRVAELPLLPVTNIAADLARSIGRSVPELDPERHFWMLLFDGLSGQEDVLTPFFATHAPRLPLVGGSFGDEERFEDVTMVHGGKVHRGSAAVLLIEYGRPFEVIHHTHMEFTEHWFEVTGTRQGGRLLTELDGRPAAEVYAEALGKDVDELTLPVTGAAPFGFRFKGRPFPCSVMTVVPDGLVLAYSVQEGDRLNLLRPVELLPKSRAVMDDAIARLRERGGEPYGLLAFHCLGRYLEAKNLHIRNELFDAMCQLRICGLNTYGEQYGPRHMNHSLCGVLFG